MRNFEFFDHTSDVGVRAFGDTLEEAFENSALAVFELMTDTSKVKAEREFKVEIDGLDMENLLYKWIESLLAEYDYSLTLFSRFQVKIDQDNLRLNGAAYGERFDPKIHERRTVVKAMTYHELEIKRNGRYIITFVVDI
ncbi:archease [Sulfuracidifex tepidarius]|uniref:Protein archease n=1 Tax=Sulfuracidifex tepidarius TaxID=1294262 RepID=A0A510DVX3_9CREN|nr:archease [Sulfuracidifex tepidarius]BBG24373.1 Protein archease [Sulfuracidifex tepidarius]BBG27131.1 Protein archease [Sulfuracidifex tepidarius]